MLANYYCCMMCNSANLGDFSKIDLTEMTVSFDCVAMVTKNSNFSYKKDRYWSK